MNTSVKDEHWDLVIKPTSSLVDLKLKEIWKYRDLLLLFVRRDFVSFYKQTILGPLWFFIQPVLTTVVFTIVFGNLAQIPTDGVPQVLFYLSGITLWNYFSDCLIKNSDTFLTNTNIFSKVYFPRLIVPLSVTISNLIRLGIQLLLFLLVWGYFLSKNTTLHPNNTILLLPLLILILAGLSVSIGIILSSLTIKYRDLKFLIQFGIQLLMYASPIAYPLSIAEGKYRWLLLANPMTSVLETFKYAFLGVGIYNPLYLLYSFSFMIVSLFLGIVLFNKVEKNFADTI